ncbi:MAG: tRNA 4-thiouridine(8) synthase ThiI [Candidatus Omnitrophota bacterium]|nr:tRNA 4-thiouridine(8) synthase ThiI [Candidatus Omnitrophota bacterium]
MKAIALISGGLDSILAARIIKEQGIEVLPLNFKIPFCPRKKAGSPDNGISSLVKRNLSEELKVVDISADFLGLLLEPKYGFGSNMNPCIDCKIFMLSKARELLQIMGAQFVVTGEVLGQRPMSQHRRALNLIEKESGLTGLLLRPLCAGLLPKTLPEKEGWVKRERLFKFSGRTRRPQMDLAQEFKMEHYPNAAGGCLLTDPGFSVRLKDLIKHQAFSLENIGLLKIGRHFRLAENAKLIVGRNEEENKELEAVSACGDYLFMPDEETAGPTCLGRGEFDDQLIKFSAQIVCHYCDLNGAVGAEIIYTHQGVSYSAQAAPIAENRLTSLRI